MAVKLTEKAVENAKKGTTTWDALATGLGLKVAPKRKKVRRVLREDDVQLCGAADQQLHHNLSVR